MFPFSRFRLGGPIGALFLVLLALFAEASVAATAAPRAATGPTLDQCSWDRPGHDAYRGDTVAAVDRYGDLDPDVRARLKARMARRDYDEVVTIRRDSITGKARYGRSISDMYFGQSTVCRIVSRAGWTDAMQERGLVYCEGTQCILVPTVCRNVSRITRAGVSPETALGELPPLAALPPVAPETSSTTVAALAPEAPGTFAEAAAPSGTVGGAIPGWPGAGEPDAPTGQPGFPVGGGGSPGGPIVVVPGGGGGGGGGGGVPPVAPVPEPGTWALMLAGLIGLAATSNRRRRMRLG